MRLLTFCCSLLAGVAAASSAAAARPAKITKCGTLSAPGSYQVTKNLEAAGDCLVVAADFVTIDLGGFVVSGNGTGEGITDKDVKRSGVALRNGTIRRFALGVALSTTADCQVEKVRVLDNVDGGISVGANAVITGNVASRNGGDGIAIGSNSLASGNSSSSNVTGFDVSPNSLVSANTASANSTIGMIVSCPSHLIGNAVIASEGILTLDAGCTSVDNNVAP